MPTVEVRTQLTVVRSDKFLDELKEHLYNRLLELRYDRQAFKRAYPGEQPHPLGVNWKLGALLCLRIPDPSESANDLVNVLDKLEAERRVTKSLSEGQLFVLPLRWGETQHPNTQGGEERQDKGAELGPSAPDANGLVREPADPKAYLPAMELVRACDPLAGRIRNLHSVLDRHPEIRRWKPRKNRLTIHMGDWREYVKNNPAVLPEK